MIKFILIFLMSFNVLAGDKVKSTVYFTPPSEYVNKKPLPKSAIKNYHVFIDGKFHRGVKPDQTSFDLWLPLGVYTMTMRTVLYEDDMKSVHSEEYLVDNTKGAPEYPVVVCQ